ncbi:MAG TPA: SRPBCC family protein [Verrucomicrobiae bacterium]|nr:SRPBCC family protein [Verrucomicrobiae bacterium]
MVKVYTSSVIEAPADRVWAAVRDFNGLPKWHPLIRDSRIENDAASDRVGCIRNFNLKDGGNIREQLLTLSDFDLSCSYSILESPMGVSNYIATLKLTPITDGERCFIEWSAEFDCAPERERELADLVGNGVFQSGFDSLKRQVTRR